MRYGLADGFLQKTQTKITKISIIFALTILGLGAGLPLALSKTVFASGSANPGDVWITAAMPNPTGNDTDGEYVTLHNNTGGNIDLNEWKLDATTISSSLTVSANSSLTLCRGASGIAPSGCDAYDIAMVLNNDGDTITIYDDSGQKIDQVSYTDGEVTEGHEVTFSLHTAAAVAPSVTPENFNTNSSSGYKGINVGFHIADFQSVSHVSVSLYKGSTLLVTNTENANLLDLINNHNTTQLSTPFIIQDGTYHEEYWNLGSHHWVFGDNPTKALIAVTGINDAGNAVTKTAENDNFVEPNGWTFESLVPPAAPSNLTFVQGAKTLACDGTGGTNVMASGTLHWTVPVGGIDQYVVTPNYPDNSGEYQFYPPGGSNSSAWVTGNFPTHGEGIYSWTIKAKGTNGLWSPAATCDVIYDTHSPTAHFTGTVPQYVNGNFSISGVANDNVKLKNVFFDVRDSSGWVAGCVAGTLNENYSNDQKDAAPTCTINTANLVNGQTYTLRIHASDFAGYGGGESRDLTIDRTTPTAEITYPTSGQYVNTRQHSGLLTIKGTASDTNFSYYYCWAMNSSGHEVGTRASLCGTNYSPVTNGVLGTIDLSGQPDGNYRVALVVRDKAGNVSQVTVPFVLDNTKPVARFTSATANPTPNGYYNQDFSVGYEVSDNYLLKSVGVSLFDTDSSHSNHWVTGCYSNGSETTADDSGTCTVYLPANLPDGKYYVAIQGQDAAGLYTVAATRTVYIDRTAPTGTATYTGGNNVSGVIYLKTINDLKYSATLSDNLALDQTSFVVFKLDSNRHRTGEFCGNWHNSSSTETVSGTAASVLSIPVSKCSWYHGLGSWAEGTYEISHIVYDKAGNSAHFNASPQRFVIDTTRPSISFTNPGDFNNSSYDQYFQTGPDLAIKATDSASGITTTVLHVYHADGSPAKFCPVSYTDTATCDTSSLSDGNYYVKAGATDNAGNNQTITKDFTIDSTRPNAHITSPSDNSYISTHDFTVTGTASDNLSGIDHVNVYIATNPWGAGGYVVNNQLASYDSITGTFTYNATGIADGTYTIKAVAYDKAGNAHFANTVHVTIDTTQPTATISHPVITDVTTGSTLSITGTASDTNFDHYTYVVQDNSHNPLGSEVTVSTPVDSDDTLGSWDISGLANGSYYAVLTVYDAAGNSNGVTSHFTINNPETPIVTPGISSGGQGGNNANFNLVASPQVLGAAITTNQAATNDNTEGDNGDSQGQVQGEQTTGSDNVNFANTTNTKSSSRFLGLGWWWLLVLAAILGAALYWLVTRRAGSDQKA